jgi:hypothetical protein
MRWISQEEGHIEAIEVVDGGAAVVVAAGSGSVVRVPLDGGDDVGFSRPDERPLRLASGGGALFVGTDAGAVWRVPLGGEGRFDDGGVRVGESLDGEVGALAATRDGALIAVAGGEDFVVELRGSDGERRFAMRTYKWPYVVRFSTDGARLAIGTWDGALHLVDVAGLREETLELRKADIWPIFDLAFAPDGALIVAGAQGIARVRLDGGEPTMVGTVSEVFAVAVSPDGSLIAAGGNEEALVLYAADTLTEVGRIALGGDAGDGGEGGGTPIPTYADYTTSNGAATVRAVAFHPDGERIFVGTDGGRVAEVAVRELLAEKAREIDERIGAALKEAMPQLAKASDELDDDARKLAEEALPDIIEAARQMATQMGALAGGGEDEDDDDDDAAEDDREDEDEESASAGEPPSEPAPPQAVPDSGWELDAASEPETEAPRQAEAEAEAEAPAPAQKASRKKKATPKKKVSSKKRAPAKKPKAGKAKAAKPKAGKAKAAKPKAGKAAGKAKAAKAKPKAAKPKAKAAKPKTKAAKPKTKAAKPKTKAAKPKAAAKTKAKAKKR